MRFKIAGILFLGLCLAGNSFSADISALFLKSGGTWEGAFVNYVNRNEGLVQKGRIVVKVAILDDGTIEQKTAFIRPDGTATDYEGSGSWKVSGNRLLWVGEANVGNVRKHRFEGFFSENQIYLFEEYEETDTDTNAVHLRHNDLHYVALSDGTILMLANVQLDGRLLVFANTILSQKK